LKISQAAAENRSAVAQEARGPKVERPGAAAWISLMRLLKRPEKTLQGVTERIGTSDWRRENLSSKAHAAG
jgi:hypothetical protein